jgi:hypothetical protein
MDYQEKIIIVAVVLLVAMAIYFVATAEQPVVEEPADSAEAQALLMKGLVFGKGLTDYSYAYTDTSDDFTIGFTLTRNGGDGLVEVKSPLSGKRAYFLENRTILCVDYPPGTEDCSVVTNNDQLDNYLTSLEVKFFDDERMDRAVRDLDYLIQNRYAVLDPELVDRGDCSELSYRLDYSTASVMDAARFGISATSPKVFDVTMCIDNRTGYVHESTFNYSYLGRDHYKTTTLISLSKFPDAITAPENLTANVFSRFEREREQQVKLAKCYTDMDGEDREKCIATLSLSLKRKDLCELAGTRRDRCLVSIVPSTRDVDICPTVNDLSFRDDCYIELAGGLKNETYCNSLQNASKMEFCLQVSEPEPEGNDLFNDSKDFLDYIETFGKDTGNESNSSA